MPSRLRPQRQQAEEGSAPLPFGPQHQYVPAASSIQYHRAPMTSYSGLQRQVELYADYQKILQDDVISRPYQGILGFPYGGLPHKVVGQFSYSAQPRLGKPPQSQALPRTGHTGNQQQLAEARITTQGSQNQFLSHGLSISDQQQQLLSSSSLRYQHQQREVFTPTVFLPPVMTLKDRNKISCQLYRKKKKNAKSALEKEAKRLETEAFSLRQQVEVAQQKRKEIITELTKVIHLNQDKISTPQFSEAIAYLDMLKSVQ